MRGLSRRADCALGLPHPWRSRARPGDAALLPRRARALLRRCLAPPRTFHKGLRRSPSSPGLGVSGRDPRAPFVPAILGLLVLELFKHGLAHLGR